MHRQARAATRSRPLEPTTRVDADAALLRAAGEVRNAHALIIGDNALELFCSLLRRGVRTAMMLRPGVRPEEGTADLAIITRVGSLDRAAAAIAHARRALAAAGRIVLRLVADASRRLALAVAGILRKNGFFHVDFRAVGDETVLVAQLG